MPLYGLPYVLERVLGQLIDDELLSSWSIHGKENGTWITLKFNNDETMDTVPDMKYKKVTPSQHRRDRERAQTRKLKKSNPVSTMNDKEHDKKKMNSVNQINGNIDTGIVENTNTDTESNSGEDHEDQGSGDSVNGSVNTTSVSEESG